MTTSTLPAAQVSRPTVDGPCCDSAGSSDPWVLRLWALMAGGMGQPAASARLNREAGEVDSGLIALLCLLGVVLVVGTAVMGRG